MSGIIGCLLVFTTTSLLSNQVVTSSCLPKIITCGCGNTTVDVRIKRCFKISSWGPVCKPCKKYRKSQLCAQYQHCFQCVDGGCLKCKKGWYGIFCEKECRCENGGSCDHYGNCQCLPRYTGEYCQTKIIKDCGSPNITVHGKVNVSNTTEGSVASFECPPNFLLVGPANQTCLDTGQWSNKVPACEYSCQVPNVSSHVVVRLESVKTSFSDYANDIELIREARFSCEEDYAIQGRQELYCLPDGTWNSDPPTCVPKIQCDELHVENGHVKYSNNDRMVGSQAILICDSDYINYYGDDLICGNDGFWKGGDFECVEMEDVIMCDDHEGPENGFVDHYSASHYEYSCEKGYFISGETHNYCVDGQLVHDVPKCVQRTTCKALDKLDGCSACYGEDCSKREHKSIDCPVPTGDVVLPEDHFLVGTVIEFRYDRKLYHLSGSRRRECKSDGVWSGRQTTCTPICGQRSLTRRISLMPRIRMGNSTNEGEWPWQVALIRIQESKVLCGGSLISHDMVLTAAHCVVRSGKRIEAGEIGIHVGSVNLKLKGQNRKLVQVKDIIVHSSYDHRKYDSDVALIQLREKLPLSPNIRPVCLPDPMDDEETVINDSSPIQPLKPSRNLTGVEGVVIGWGQTENGSYPDILKATNVTIVDQQVCFRYSEELNPPVMSVTDNMFCAVGSNPSRSDACSGDSGGPFLVEDEPGIWTVVGIVGFGPSCSISVEERYGFYTRVDKFLPWIHDNF